MTAALATLLVLLGAPHISPAPAIADEVSRLAGHQVTLAADGRSYTIVSVAGEGKPIVGVVQQRGDQLWLAAGKQRYRLTGPLAIPRIAGPRYKVWVLGEVSGVVLRARRLGVLARPTWRKTSLVISGAAPTRTGGPQ